MADTLISDMPVNSTPTSNDIFETVQAGVSRQLSFSVLLGSTIFNTAVDARVAIAVATGITPGGAAGGDLTGTYPNPVLVAIGGLVPGAYGGGAAIPVVTVDAKGRVVGITTTPVTTNLVGTVRYDAPQSLSVGEKGTARANIDAQPADTRLTAAVGIVGAMADSLVVWDDDTTAHKINLIPAMETFLAAATMPAALLTLGGAPIGFSDIQRIAANHVVVAGDEVLVVDASAGTVLVTLPLIDPTQDGRRIIVKARDATNTITIACDAADDIDGAASLALTVTHQSYTLVASYDAGGSFWSIT